MTRNVSTMVWEWVLTSSLSNFSMAISSISTSAMTEYYTTLHHSTLDLFIVTYMSPCSDPTTCYNTLLLQGEIPGMGYDWPAVVCSRQAHNTVIKKTRQYQFNTDLSLSACWDSSELSLILSLTRSPWQLYMEHSNWGCCEKLFCCSPWLWGRVVLCWGTVAASPLPHTATKQHSHAIAPDWRRDW